MKPIRIEIPGKPIAKKRPRFVRRGKHVLTYNDQETEEGRFLWEVKAQVGNRKPLKGPVAINLIFIMPVLSNWPKYKLKMIKEGQTIWHTKKPDTDNCIKFCLDCLNQVLFTDDRQITVLNAKKYYGLEPKTIIQVGTL